MTAHAHSEAHVLAEIRNHIGHLTLNRPAGLNALTLDMVRSLQHHRTNGRPIPRSMPWCCAAKGPRASAPAATSARCTTATGRQQPVSRLLRRGICPRPVHPPLPQAGAGSDGRLHPRRRHGPGPRRRHARRHRAQPPGHAGSGHRLFPRCRRQLLPFARTRRAGHLPGRERRTDPGRRRAVLWPGRLVPGERQDRRPGRGPGQTDIRRPPLKDLRACWPSSVPRHSTMPRWPVCAL